MTSPNDPIYYGHRCGTDDKPVYFHQSPSRHFVEIHGMPHPIVQLRIRERRDGDPESRYWGWLDFNKPDRYVMIWPSRAQSDMCFPYGPKAEEKAGCGRQVNLIVEEIVDGT